MKKPVLLWLFFQSLILGTLDAQMDSSGRKKEKIHFDLGMFYNSQLNYYGRTDSLKSGGFFPLAELRVGNSFYINAVPVFVNNSVSSMEYSGTVTTVGFKFKGKKGFEGAITFIKPFYRNQSQLVQSALEAQLNINFSNKNKIINITGGGDIKFSDNLDYGITVGLDHVFRMDPGNGLFFVLNPTANVYAGTQQFASTYYKQSSFLFLPVAEEEVTKMVGRFNILSYEFSLPLVVGWRRLQFILGPAYVIPQNLIITKNRPDLSERGVKTLYTTIGLKFNIK